ncbi:PIN domain-containing protein [Cellulomonas hominis]|uniref:PIN domain-containing protein n=1 Tax=Cellulomonas hominis TaxID=156981 RepID=UPI001B9017A1|nr:PIN domain-containing protein [Cellulomonas hominis]VTR75475.1 hypothetical protein CHMI_00221 [Cellulomonas hominis]
MAKPENSLRPRQPVLVIDTTAFFVDLRLSRDLADVLDAAGSGMIRVVVPEVVVLETGRHQAEKANKASNEAIKKVADGLRALNEIIDGLPRFDARDARDRLTVASEEYETWLRKTLDDHMVEVAPIPSVDHVELVKRDLARRKPFDNGGKGYRDALIWSTVVEVARGLDVDDHLIFVTNNTQDFVDSGSLSADLLRDLPAGGPQISHRVTAGEAISLVAPAIDALTAEIEHPGQWLTADLVIDLVREHVEEEMSGLTGADASVSISTSPLENPTWYSVEFDFSDLTWQVSSTYGADDLALEISIEADITIDGYVNKWDYYGSEGNSDLDVLDHDWNETMIWASVNRRAVMDFSVDVDRDFSGVGYVELIDAREGPLRRP